MPVFTDYPTFKGTSLNDLLGSVSNLQQFQQQQQLMPLQLQKAQLELERQQATQQPEIERVKSLSRQQLGTEQPAITQQEQLAEQSKITTEKNRYDLNEKQTGHMDDELGALITDKRIQGIKSGDVQSVDSAKEALLEARSRLEQRGIKPQAVEAHLRPLFDLMEKKPEVLGQALSNIVQRGQNAQQFAQINQTPTTVSTGASNILLPQSPFQPNRPAQVFAQQPGPTTEYIAEPNNPFGLPVGTKYLLPSGGSNTALNQKGNATSNQQSPMVTGLASSVSAPIEQSVINATDDWKNTYNDSLQSQQRKGIFQNIKKLSSEAFTGVGGQRKELAAGIFNSIGIPFEEAAKTATDELAKNSALLQMAGGNTDLARQIAEIASPNKKMNEQAIKNVADQMIGVENMKNARFKFLAPYKNDPLTYDKKRTEILPYMDSRLYQDMSPQDVAAYKRSLTPAERAEISKKIAGARQLGLIK
jgi:hypothetical protein